MPIARSLSIVSAIVQAAFVRSFALGFAFFAVFLLFGCFGSERGLRFERLGLVEVVFEIADAKRFQVELRIPSKGCGLSGNVMAIRTVNHIEYESAVFCGTRYGTEFVHRPAQGHSSCARYETEAGTKASCAASGAWRTDRAQRF